MVNILHPAIQRARQLLAERPAREAAWAKWREAHAAELDDAFCRRMQAERAAREQAAAEAEREQEEQRAEWQAAVSQWQQAQGTRPSDRVVYKDWHDADEPEATEDRTLFQIMADVISDETVRALQSQKHDLLQQIDSLRSAVHRLEQRVQQCETRGTPA